MNTNALLLTYLLTWNSSVMLSGPPDLVCGTNQATPAYTEIYWSTVINPPLSGWTHVANVTNQNACPVPWSTASNNFYCVRDVWTNL